MIIQTRFTHVVGGVTQDSRLLLSEISIPEMCIRLVSYVLSRPSHFSSKMNTWSPIILDAHFAPLLASTPSMATTSTIAPAMYTAVCASPTTNQRTSI
ncbi:hypothetical protein WAI453_007646 [Rhynchosporium graminicola]